MFGSMDISTSALTAYRTKLDVIVGNIAMKGVTRDEFGNLSPYRRRVALLSPGRSGAEKGQPGVHVQSIQEDPTPFELRYDPGHIDAIKQGDLKGYVRMSNVDYHTEMVNAMMVARAYEANVTVMEMSKRMGATALSLVA